tara:strand:+ start:2609 stop:2893 length:285 start_codon:yes stop_codon:yes gene_type:complete
MMLHPYYYLNASLGTAIQTTRHAKGITRSDLSSQIGFPERLLIDLEEGKITASIMTLCEIAHNLDVSPTYILRLAAFEQEALRHLNEQGKAQTN